MVLIKKIADKRRLFKQYGWKNVWLAYQAIKNKKSHQLLHELAEFFCVVSKLNPMCILEIGVAQGGTYQAWRSIVPKARCIMGIDPLSSSYPNVIQGYSQDRATFNRVKAKLPQPLDLLFIDGDHRYQQVKADLEMYGEFVRPGGIVALHDIVPAPPNSHAFSGDVHKVWKKVKANQATHEIIADPNQEGYGIGYFYKE